MSKRVIREENQSRTPDGLCRLQLIRAIEKVGRNVISIDSEEEDGDLPVAFVNVFRGEHTKTEGRINTETSLEYKAGVLFNFDPYTEDAFEEMGDVERFNLERGLRLFTADTDDDIVALADFTFAVMEITVDVSWSARVIGTRTGYSFCTGQIIYRTQMKRRK